MNILALSDIHGAYQRAAQIIEKESADVVVIAGDLTTVGSIKEAENALREFQTLVPRILCVAGNMDLPQHDELFAGLGVSLNARGVIIDDVGFFGVSSAPLSPLHTPYEIAESEIALRIAKGYAETAGARLRIFVPHAPPYGTKTDIVHAGFHVGSTSVLEFIEEQQPDVVVCGHIHEARGQDSIGKTRIVNCGPLAHGYFARVNAGEVIRITLCHHPY